ncbi:AraC family transcriptional regulator [Chryseobacterium phosphatilyticum]|uniref:AraC family transcriptional regulator n=1 Tax=Chryseobacterium phosphatilyticum TaxID=475075 RepID=A0A316XC74_9FLAO|nr:helix-turn-helix domain-containing protein [Chryseobacterium phosphatilyticum]PWN71134.1 AraC family transcriptional regulator [Chryseobacterium phosphatilyticum]
MIIDKARINKNSVEEVYNQGIDVVFQDEINAESLNFFPDNSFTIILIDQCDHGKCITDLGKYDLRDQQLFIHLPKRDYKWDLPLHTVGRRLIIKDSVLKTFSPTLKFTFSSYSKFEMIQPDEETYHRFSIEFNAIRKEILADNVFPELINARVRLLALIINLWVEHAYGNKALNTPDNLAFRFHMLVDKNFKNQKNVAFYAQELCITPNYLGVICRKQYVVSPLEFIKERIILEAKNLLHSSDKSIKEIAFELGFRNFSHFSYLFRMKTGSTPKAYREKLAETGSHSDYNIKR